MRGSWTDRGKDWMAVLMVALLFWGGAQKAALAQEKFVTEYLIDREVIEIPFEYVQRQIFIKAEINSKKDLTFLLDTGASAPVLDESLGISGYRLPNVTVQEAEGMTRVESGVLDSVRMVGEKGKVESRNIAALIADLSQLTKMLGRRVDGIIGATFLNGFVTEIDYQKKRLRFYDSRQYSIAQRKPDNQRTFLFNLHRKEGKRPSRTLFMWGLLHERYEYEFLLDTGFGGYVSVDAVAATESGLITKDTPRVPSNNFSVTRRFTSNKIRASFLQFGKMDLRGKVIQVDNRNKEMMQAGEVQVGIIGNRFFQNYRITLDFPRQALWLERVTDKEEEDDAEKVSLGLSVKVSGTKAQVERVIPHSPAHRYGIRPGDALLTINGREVSNLHTAQIMTLLQSVKGEVNLSLERGIDPNLGSRGQRYSLVLFPASPLDWKAN